ncbi:MAG: helix-turn-helix domain-containing protein [Thermodesulfobacteriota bacterium]
MAKKSERSEKGRGAVSRERILAAARKVFARHPYGSASMREIGKEGGFDHPLIHYYFPNKASLFEAVLLDIIEELYQANKQWFEGLTGSDIAGDLSIHLDRLLEYDLMNPEPLKIIFMNMAALYRRDTVPGLSYIPLIIAGTKQNFLEQLPMKASPEELSAMNHTFASSVIWYLGANHCHGTVLGIDPTSRQYREWVKKALTSAFMPWLEKVVPDSPAPGENGGRAAAATA